MRHYVSEGYEQQIKIAKKLIEKYCIYYGLTAEDLKEKHEDSGYLVKKVNGTRMDIMRSCLAYFIYLHSELRQRDISPLLGYSNRSAIQLHLETVKGYLETGYPLLESYYNRLKEIAGELAIDERMRCFTMVENKVA